jgi:hypothetical protein
VEKGGDIGNNRGGLPRPEDLAAEPLFQKPLLSAIIGAFPIFCKA